MLWTYPGFTYAFDVRPVNPDTPAAFFATSAFLPMILNHPSLSLT